MLAVGSWLPPIDRARLRLYGRPIERYVFAVALHRQLLEIGRETLQVRLVGQHRDGLRAEEVVVPDAKKAHEYRQVAATAWSGNARRSRGSPPTGRGNDRPMASMVERSIAESIE